jgi:enoyl-CoA hydratase/carnithine racemase
MPEGVRIARDGPVQILRFDRPEKKNAITGAMYDALAEALEAASRDEGIGVSVVLGSPEIFTAGNDIGDFIRMAAQSAAFGEPILRFLRAVATHDRPLLAGVDGLAVGVGTTLLLHCDYVLATPRSLFRTPFTALGLVPEAASSLLAPRVMGHARAFELLVMGRDFDAERALAAGLVNAVVSPEALEPQILAAALGMAARPRQAVLASRRLLKGDAAETLARIDAEAALFAERLASREAQEAFAAFMGKGKS